VAKYEIEVYCSVCEKIVKTVSDEDKSKADRKSQQALQQHFLDKHPNWPAQ
jgi:uncharacterized Zn finger protein (UPF0148 family)